MEKVFVEKLWDQVKGRIKNEVLDASFKAFFEETTVTLDNDVLKIISKSEFHSDWLRLHFQGLILNTIEEVTGSTVEVCFGTLSKDDTASDPIILKETSHESIEETALPFIIEIELVEKLWDQVKEQIMIEVSKPSFVTFVQETTATLDNDVLIIYSKSEFHSDWIRDKYQNLILKSIKKITGGTMELRFEMLPKNDTASVPTKLDQNSNETLEESVLKMEIERLKNRVDKLEERLYALENKEQ
ncbi:DnaA N-terminal domain-containing protein [Bacillus bombysepticus]|uniref:DnaA N-terminal domain-containing protein n=1 Tax=Bacillus bombysepticus TaxID=658666 RepID=UPI00301A3176